MEFYSVHSNHKAPLIDPVLPVTHGNCQITIEISAKNFQRTKAESYLRNLPGCKYMIIVNIHRGSYVAPS